MKSVTVNILPLPLPFRLHLSRRRAVAAAILGSTEAVDFVLTDTGNRFEVEASGDLFPRI